MNLATFRRFTTRCLYPERASAGLATVISHNTEEALLVLLDTLRGERAFDHVPHFTKSARFSSC